jgi:hypothetical protein
MVRVMDGELSPQFFHPLAFHVENGLGLTVPIAGSVDQRVQVQVRGMKLQKPRRGRRSGNLHGEVERRMISGLGGEAFSESEKRRMESLYPGSERTRMECLRQSKMPGAWESRNDLT